MWPMGAIFVASQPGRLHDLRMDKLDRKLLNLLQKDSHVSAEDIAERVPLSPSAITRRIKRLRDRGIIASEVVVLTSEIREKRITAVVNLQLERHQPSEWHDLKRLLEEAPEVQLCLETSGTMDVLMIVSARDMERFNAFADEIGGHSLVKRYETTFVKKHVKASVAIPLEED